MIHDVYYYLTGKREAEIRQGMKELYGDVPVDQWRDSMNRYKEAILAEEKESTKARFARFTKGAEAAHLPNRISLLFFPRKIATYFELEKMPSTF